MTAQSKSVIKSYFQTGDKPTQSQFTDFIDSYQDAANNLSILTSAGLGAVGLQLLSCNTSASASSIIGGGGGITVSAANIQFNNSNRLLGNVSAGVGTELSSIDLTFSGTTVNLATTAVSAGTYTNPTVTFDTKGRATSVSNGAVGGSELVLLGTGTASNSASLNFTSLISSSYDYYFFILKDLVVASSSVLWMRYSKNNGSSFVSTSGQYQNQLSLHALASNTITVSNGGGSLTALPITATNGTDSLNGKINLFNPLSSVSNVYLNWDVEDNSGLSMIEGYGVFSDVSINAVQFLASTGNLTSGSIEMYGVKNS